MTDSPKPSEPARVHITLTQYDSLGPWYAESEELGKDFHASGATLAEAFNKALSNLVLVKIEDFIKERITTTAKKGNT